MRAVEEIPRFALSVQILENYILISSRSRSKRFSLWHSLFIVWFAFGRVTNTAKQAILTPAYAKFVFRGEIQE